MSKLTEILRTARWGDYQREDGQWSVGIANAPELEAAIMAWVDENYVPKEKSND